MELQDEVDNLKARAFKLEGPILDAFVKKGRQRLSEAGVTVYMETTTYVSTKKMLKVVEYFRKLGEGYEDMIRTTETVPKLQEFVKSERDNDILDPKLEELVSITDNTRLRVRRTR